MAAYAALVSLMSNIHQIMKHPRFPTLFDENQIQTLVDKAGFLLDFMEKNKYSAGGNEGEDLEKQIASAAHASEDVIESHIVDQIHAEYSLECSLDLQQNLEDMDAVMEKAAKLQKIMKLGSREERDTHFPAAEPTMESELMGLDAELHQLLHDLTGFQSSRLIISITGMGGIGKTTLAQHVYANSLIKEHFQLRAWATVSEQHDAGNVLSQLLSSLGKSTSGSVDSLGEQLHKTLSGRRYLIILDDLWSMEAWDAVRRFFPDNGNRSRVVLTTRMLNVARNCDSSSIVEMKLLDEGKSWNLFCEKVFHHGDCPNQFEEIGKEIVRLCKGLALSIVVIGGVLLKAPRTVEYWGKVVRDLKYSIHNSKEEQESLDVLALSYNHLPPHLKPCFLYMGVFEEDARIRVSNIVTLWVAEGFIKDDGGRVLEEIAEDYLKDLIDRNLIVVGKLRYNGKIGSCGIHDLLRELCLKVGQQQQLFDVATYNTKIEGRMRRILCADHLKPGWIRPPPLVRSIIWREWNYDPAENRLVRVIETSVSSSPEELYRNVNLRYLAHTLPSGDIGDNQRLWELPSSISRIWNLQTLTIKRSFYDEEMAVAPTEIWNVRQLRHLKCHKIYLPVPDDPLVQNLDKLQTLKEAVNLRLCEKIIPNIIKLRLHYDRGLHGYDDSLIEGLCNLNRLHKLKSLCIKIKGSGWPTPVSELNKKLTFPSSLSKLSLSHCGLHWDDLAIIGSLPRLEVLELHQYSVKGKRWSPVTEQFLRLKILEVNIHDLVHWDADNSHFPVLEKLVLRNLYILKQIPSGIGEIPTLELIRMDCCSISAAVSAIKIKEDRLDYEGDDGLQVHIIFFRSRLETFNKMVEAEGLTTDNIHPQIL